MIRLARPADAGELAALKRATFRETFLEAFRIPYPADDLATFEATWHAVDAVSRELADPDRATWVAEDGEGGLAGYAQVGPCKLPHPEVRPGDGELYQLYVRRTAHGTGTGRTLLDSALDHLRSARPGSQWLGVWSGNERAQAVYRKRGFQPVGTYQFAVGSWLDEELIFRRD